MDVNSLVYNFQIAYDQDRFSGTEYTMGLATAKRLMERVDVQPGTPLESEIVDLAATMTNPSSDDYSAGVAAVGDLCIAGGFTTTESSSGPGDSGRGTLTSVAA